jgi:hypothetical protein
MTTIGKDVVETLWTGGLKLAGLSSRTASLNRSGSDRRKSHMVAVEVVDEVGGEDGDDDGDLMAEVEEMLKNAEI